MKPTILRYRWSYLAACVAAPVFLFTAGSHPEPMRSAMLLLGYVGGWAIGFVAGMRYMLHRIGQRP